MSGAASLVRSVPTLTLAGAKIAADAAEAKAKELGIAINIAVAGQTTYNCCLASSHIKSHCPRSSPTDPLLDVTSVSVSADHTTYLIYFVRMDNAKITSMEIAIDKVPLSSPLSEPLAFLGCFPRLLLTHWPPLSSASVRPTRQLVTAIPLPTIKTSVRRAGRRSVCRSAMVGASMSCQVAFPSSTQKAAPASEPSEPAGAVHHRSSSTSQFTRHSRRTCTRLALLLPHPQLCFCVAMVGCGVCTGGSGRAEEGHDRLDLC